ncbi:LysR family transcriptional regulator [Streptomyces sp. SID8374]|uniref:TniQ family protein n=1 Tax=Streptomyces sp. SID8374 TaxID=2690354 RepID=UPI00136A3CFD|nr:TniQ family protein [Streptomyces sp. SID8374]MYX14977.1 LysR family transcriptional regulator [Streptomyces sp. SID8374]
MNDIVRTLPIRMRPLAGEALDSWLEALAGRLDAQLGEVLRHLGLPVRDRSGNHLRGIPSDWTILLNEQQIGAITHASGLDEQTVTGMTLAHFDSRAVEINFERRYVNRRVLWGRGRGSRFCPDCLRETGGRWPLFWRLGWAFACPRHGRLLADFCPECGRIPRQRPRSGRVVPRPGQCGNPAAYKGGPLSGGCGFDLSLTRTLRLPAEHPALRAQELLMNVIETDSAAFGSYALSPQPSRAALADLRAIGGRVLADLPGHDIRNLVPADIAEDHFTVEPGSQLALRAVERPGFMAPPRAVSTAVAVSIALHVLGQPDIHRAGTELRGLLDAMREELWQISPTSIDSWGRGQSPVLSAVNLAALAPSLRPSEHLRYRTPTAIPRLPKRTVGEITRRARKIPSMLWPSWTVRLTPPDGVYPRTLAPVLAASLLVIDSKVRLEDAAEHLGSVTDGIGISRILQILDDQQPWPDTVTALIRLSDHLDTTEVPINYQRRRRLDYMQLLPHERWRDICRHTGAMPGNGLRERVVRCQLFQHISGLPAEAAPGHSSINEAWFRAEAVRFATIQIPDLAQALANEARTFLADHGIHDEPVTWQPPVTLLTGLDLPGPDPDRIDVAQLHKLVRQRKSPVQHAAETFGTSIEAIRLVLDEHPAPALPPNQPTAQVTGLIRLKARHEVPKETFARLYLDEHCSLQQIAERTGFSRQLLTALAHEYDIPVRDGPQDYKRRGTIERAWLIEQYVVRRRTLPDLARETGMSPANMARWAHSHKIPLRPRGGASHHAVLRTADEAEALPAILRKALTGPSARQRLSRFLAARSYPTLTEAARDLGIHRSALVVQINRLEADLGQSLFERAERGRAMKLTVFGEEVVAAARNLGRGKDGTLQSETGEGA